MGAANTDNKRICFRHASDSVIMCKEQSALIRTGWSSTQTRGETHEEHE